MPFTTSVANQILNKILKNTDFTPASNLYVSLHTADPGDSGSYEVSGGSYARQAVAFGSVSAKSVSNTAAINFTTMPACTATHVGLWSAASGGTYWWGGALTASKTVNAGDTFQIGISGLSVTLT